MLSGMSTPFAVLAQRPARSPRSPRWRRLAGALSVLTPLVLLALAMAALVPPLRHPFVLASLARQGAPAALPVPVEGVKSRGLADTWGAARSGGRKHQGIDIFAKRGTPVLSATPGIVLRVGQNRLGGNVVMVIGPGLEAHYYAHLDAFGAFEPGDVVRTGDVLGRVGDTGNAKGTPPHLHYGIYRPGGAVNPFPRLTAKARTPVTGGVRLTHRRRSARSSPAATRGHAPPAARRGDRSRRRRPARRPARGRPPGDRGRRRA